MEKVHKIGLQPLHYQNVLDGQKIYEGRLNDEKRKEFNIGDYIEILKDPKREESFKVVIVNKFLFESFREMVEVIDLVKLGFANSSKQEVIDTYRSFYSKEDEEKYGVVIFELKVIK